MLQILGTPGYTCNRLRLLSQNSFEDVKLSVRVDNCRCSRGLKLTEKYFLDLRNMFLNQENTMIFFSKEENFPGENLTQLRT